MDSKKVRLGLQKIKSTLKDAVILAGSDSKSSQEKLKKITLDLLVDVMDIEHRFSEATGTEPLPMLPETKKRGRKQKSEVEAAAPKKRGRKQKSKLVAAAPKKRGRKKKSELEATAPKKRGRKKKELSAKEKRAYKNVILDVNDPTVVASEIRKVSRRLPAWSASQSQFNAMILTTFLSLQDKTRKESINLKDFTAAFDDPKKFKLNFNTMKSISRNNNCKVFDIVGESVSIWKPIQHLVDEYKRQIRGNGSSASIDNDKT